jgi:acyl carrier protein
MKTEIFEELQEVLAIATGHSVEEIQPATQLEADLGVNMEDDFPRILNAVNQRFEIKLQPGHVLQELEEAGDSVEQLAKLVEEEVELG